MSYAVAPKARDREKIKEARYIQWFIYYSRTGAGTVPFRQQPVSFGSWLGESI